MQHDDHVQCERDSKRRRVIDSIAQSSTDAAESSTASPAPRHQQLPFGVVRRAGSPAPFLVAEPRVTFDRGEVAAFEEAATPGARYAGAGGSLLATVQGAEVWRAGIESKYAVPVFKEPTRSCEIGDAFKLPLNAPTIAGPGKFLVETEGVGGVLQHLKAKASPAKARPRPKANLPAKGGGTFRLRAEGSDVAEDISARKSFVNVDRRSITRPAEDGGRTVANLVGDMHVAKGGPGSGIATSSAAVECVSDLDADYQRWFRHAPDVIECVSETGSGCLQRHHTCGHESEVPASTPVVVEHEGPAGGKAGKSDG
jgi:hypothetical protein